MAERSDAELLRQTCEGDAQAFANLVARHTPRVYRFTRTALGDPDDAQDVTQETFIEAFRHARRFDGSSSAVPWLLGIAANRCRTFRRRLVRRPQSLEALLEGEWPEAAREWAAEPDEAADTAVRLDIRRAVADLPLGYRAPVIMRYQEGLSHAEIGEALGIEPNTACMRVHRAKGMLRERLRHLWDLE